MKSGDYKYICQSNHWLDWQFDLAALAGSMAVVSRAQGMLMGRLARRRQRAEGSPQRFYSLSAQIQRERKAYYDSLERTQKRSMDVTEWLAWFLDTLQRAVDQAQLALDAVLTKARFWHRWATAPLSERQVKLLDRLLDGRLTSSKWAAIATCSPDTALRDINDLRTRGVLRRSDARGRSTSYEPTDVTAAKPPQRLNAA